MIEIEITGPPGSGKSTAANIIVKALLDSGIFQVKEDECKWESKNELGDPCAIIVAVQLSY